MHQRGGQPVRSVDGGVGDVDEDLAAQLLAQIAVREQVHELLHQVRGVLAPSRELDLSTLDRAFTLRRHDSLVAFAGQALLAAVREKAPGVRLRFLAESGTDTPELRRGEVDLEANASRPTAPDVRAEKVTVSRRGRLGNALDQALARLGLTRRVVAAVPTEAAAFAFARHGPRRHGPRIDRALSGPGPAPTAPRRAAGAGVPVVAPALRHRPRARLVARSRPHRAGRSGRALSYPAQGASSPNRAASGQNNVEPWHGEVVCGMCLSLSATPLRCLSNSTAQWSLMNSVIVRFNSSHRRGRSFGMPTP